MDRWIGAAVVDEFLVQDGGIGGEQSRGEAEQEIEEGLHVV
jgi:hypothetical protein